MTETFTDKSKLKKGRQYNKLIDEESGQVLYVDKNSIIYSIYILYRNHIPIYVGKTTNIINRIKGHRSSKRNFDSYSIPFVSHMELTANITEQVLISYLKSIYPSLENKCSVRPCGEIIKL